MNCVDCKKEILYAKSAIYSGPTGGGKKKPRCVGCHEEVVRVAGRKAAKVRRWPSSLHLEEPNLGEVDQNGDEGNLDDFAYWFEYLDAAKAGNYKRDLYYLYRGMHFYEWVKK